MLMKLEVSISSPIIYWACWNISFLFSWFIKYVANDCQVCVVRPRLQIFYILLLLSICQDMAKKDEGNPQKSDDEAEKKAGSGDEEDEIEEEGYDEEDVEVRLRMRTWNCYCTSVECKRKRLRWRFPCCSLQENDYNESYFDNGETFAADSDDNMDAEATYWECAN